MVKSLQELVGPASGASFPGLDARDDPGEDVGLSCTAVVSCSVCSLVSISNAAPPVSPPCPINPVPLPPTFDLRELWGGGRRLHTQQAPKNKKATSSRIGPMMIGGLAEGTSVLKANAPTRVMLSPASMMHRPQAQQSAGEGRPWGRDDLLFFFWDSFLGTGVPVLLSVMTMISPPASRSVSLSVALFCLPVFQSEPFPVAMSTKTLSSSQHGSIFVCKTTEHDGCKFYVGYTHRKKTNCALTLLLFCVSSDNYLMMIVVIVKCPPRES